MNSGRSLCLIYIFFEIVGVCKRSHQLAQIVLGNTIPSKMLTTSLKCGKVFVDNERRSCFLEYKI